ncbi:glutathione S-transferase family protein [Emcibacter nanhaiensis]|uniref:Glutathione S-transferase family protein n=1 Tax=Emcibacter nanhaiensis TaxID=1505037 RepID=A0A501PC65_9PROT|nr:glutathione S-transferase family protein [Emcibacter nanhaiensis]TPD57815.1 glutathione S-transferase family protein [Emcibacter nanhaiensis]
MSDFSLIIGNKNASSWSLRPWLVMKEAGLEFEEIIVDLFSGARQEKIRKLNPAGRVPALRHGGQLIWDSLAICEYIAELAPDKKLWPEDRAARARARSVSAEMHAGFPTLRGRMPMACLQTYPTPQLEGDLLWEVGRIRQIWRECLEASDGPFLFGHFTIADAMYAPVVSRYRTYQVPLDPPLQAYAERMLEQTAMKDWFRECNPADVE